MKDANEAAAMLKPGEGRLAHAPQDHPPVPRARIGVLLANLGTPDATDYWSMRRYLGQFLSDRRVIDYSPFVWQPLLQLVILSKRPFSSGEAYRGIWNNEADESPLLTITKAQTAGMAERLSARFGDAVEVDFCMRYGNPSTRSVIERMQARGCERILFFALYPHYAAATTGTANDEAFRALMRLRWQPAFRTVPAYYDHPLYIEALAQSIERRLEARRAEGMGPPEVLVCSYHGLPRRYLMEGDPYHCQCHVTTRLLRGRMGDALPRIETTFQSRFGPEEWLQPYTVEHVAALAGEGVRDLMIMAPGFSSDCVETLEEINEEIKESYEEAGGEGFDYVPCLNSDPAHLDMVEAIVARELGGWIGG